MANKLGKELFRIMQAPQGLAFISDRVETLSDEDVIKIAENSLEWQEKGVERLREFLKAHKGAKHVGRKNLPEL